MSQSLIIGKNALIREGLPVSLFGLDFYPITMRYYENFLCCSGAISVRLSTLPVKYLSKDYLTAMFLYDLDHKDDLKYGFFKRIIQMLQLSLRVEWSMDDIVKMIRYKTQNGETLISELVIVQGEKTSKITSEQFSQSVRPLLAELNGIRLPDESENLDLVLANEQKKELNQKTKKLNTSVSDLISSVAYLSGCRESDINDWSIREFEARRRAIERDKLYTLYGQAEMSGMVSFKNGNPAPSWCYDVLDESLGTQALSELNFGDAKQKEF